MTSLACQRFSILRSLLPTSKIEIRRNLSFRKFQQAYQSYFEPRKVMPPYVHVCQVGDPVLRAHASLVDPEIVGTEEFQKLVDHMRDVMRKYGGVGLAAPQIGVSMQVFVAEVTQKQIELDGEHVAKTLEKEPFPLKVFINPTLKVQDYSALKFPEGCLSIRGFHAEVPRARAVQISGLDARGEPHTWEAKGWAARIAQHEMDHLRGALYIDKMDSASFACTAWQEINRSQGRIELPYYVK